MEKLTSLIKLIFFLGALNLTRKAQKQSLDAEIKAIQIFENVLANSERQCKRAMTLYNRSIDEVNNMRHNNERTIASLKNRLESLNEKIPKLNEMVNFIFIFLFFLRRLKENQF